MGADTAGFFVDNEGGVANMMVINENDVQTALSSHAGAWPEALSVSDLFPKVKVDQCRPLDIWGDPNCDDGTKRFIAEGRAMEILQVLAWDRGLLWPAGRQRPGPSSTPAREAISPTDTVYPQTHWPSTGT